MNLTDPPGTKCPAAIITPRVLVVNALGCGDYLQERVDKTSEQGVGEFSGTLRFTLNLPFSGGRLVRCSGFCRLLGSKNG